MRTLTTLSVAALTCALMSSASPLPNRRSVVDPYLPLHNRDAPPATSLTIGNSTITASSIAFGGSQPQWPQHFTQLWDSLTSICNDVTCNAEHQECFDGLCISADGFFNPGERDGFIKVLRNAFDEALVRKVWQDVRPTGGRPPRMTVVNGVDEIAPDYLRVNSWGEEDGGRTMRVNMYRQR